MGQIREQVVGQIDIWNASKLRYEGMNIDDGIVWQDQLRNQIPHESQTKSE